MFTILVKDTNDGAKASYILLWSGEKGLDVYSSRTFSKEEDRKKAAVILKKKENQLEPKTSYRIHTYTLQEMRQEADEPIDNYISKLKNQAAKCQFPDNAEVEDRVLDQLMSCTKRALR